ncbi:MAG: hypothetical protein QM667_01755 [Asticcacaulis sp.]
MPAPLVLPLILIVRLRHRGQPQCTDAQRFAMISDIRTIESALDRLLYVYATDDDAEDAVVRAMAILISDPLPELTGDDITSIRAYIYHALQGFYASRIDYAGIRRDLLMAILAARKGNTVLRRIIA